MLHAYIVRYCLLLHSQSKWESWGCICTALAVCFRGPVVAGGTLVVVVVVVVVVVDVVLAVVVDDVVVPRPCL